MPLADSSMTGQSHVQCTCRLVGEERQAEFSTYDRNVVFPTASSPNNNMDIVCGSMELATNELSQNSRLLRAMSEPMLACEAEGGDYNASIGAAIGTYR